jgi:hypothetical protein
MPRRVSKSTVAVSSDARTRISLVSGGAGAKAAPRMSKPSVEPNASRARFGSRPFVAPSRLVAWA